MPCLRKILFLLVLCVSFIAGNSFAEKLEKFSYTGLQRIEPSTIKAYLHLKPGDDMTPEKLNESIKSLYKTGFFSNVSLIAEGNTLVVEVEENPIINRVAFEGNRKLTDDTITKEIKLPPRTVYNAAKIQELQQKILKMYRLAGRFGATVEPKVIKQPENRVDVVFEIKEGPSTFVQKIVFQGNQRFSDSTLNSVIQTKEYRWYRFFTNDDTYDPDRMAYDQALLKQFYLEAGYIDFKINSSIAEISPNKDEFYITYVINEGERYKINDVKIDNPLADLNDQELLDAVTVHSGDWYNANEIEESMEAISKVAGDAGYAFVDPEPLIEKDEQNHTVNIIFKILQGPKVYIERIDIEGNTRTRDDVIRREFRLAEGDPYNATKLKRTEQRLHNLGFFKKVKISEEKGSSPDRVIIKVNVEEQVTGELQFAISYGTRQGIGGDIGIAERNLMGKGQDVSLKLRATGRSQGVDFAFTEPYFMHRDLAAGVNVFAMKSKEKENGTTDTSIGGRTWIGYEINEHLSQRLNYGLTFMDSDYSARTSEFIKEQPKHATNSSVGVTTTYDKRDSSIEPRSGYIGRLGNEFVGVGGTSRFVKNTASAAQYFPLWKESVLAFSGEGGIISTLGKTVRTPDRFELGGFSLRGFDFGGVSPRDKRGERDALGGLQYYQATAETAFPIGLPKEFNVKGSLFFDVGSVWDAQKSNANIFDKNMPRYSVGFGLSWGSPMGPIRLDFAKPIKKDKYDKTREFLFGFTTRF